MARFCLTIKKDGNIVRQSGHTWKNTCLEDFESEINYMKQLEKHDNVCFDSYSVRLRKKNSHGNKKYETYSMVFKDGKFKGSCRDHADNLYESLIDDDSKNVF